MNEINKEKPHAYTFLFEEKWNNPSVILLNSLWKFHWSTNPQACPQEFYVGAFSADKWENILVPGNWEHIKPKLRKIWEYFYFVNSKVKI